jgi:hypothetical protein
LEGEFDAINDLSQVFRFAIRGDSGFDPEEVLYWRHHPMQAIKVQKGMVLNYYSGARNLLTGTTSGHSTLKFLVLLLQMNLTTTGAGS